MTSLFEGIPKVLWGTVATACGAFALRRWLKSRKVNTTGSVVVITGCDSGFGLLLCKTLSQSWNALRITVVATCLTKEGKTALDALPHVYGVISNVCSDDDVAKLVDTTMELAPQALTKGVWGIVNNAGIGDGGLLELSQLTHYQKVMDVNFFGTVRMCKAFMPLIQKAQGRIVNIASIAGRIGAPGMTSYCGSKWAVEGLSIALRGEMKPWHVNVSLIEPSFFATGIIDTNRLQSIFQRTWEGNSAEVREKYGGDDFLQFGLDRMVKVNQMGEKRTDKVINCLIHALTARVPKSHYLVGNQAPILAIMGLAPGWVWDNFQALLNRPNFVPVAARGLSPLNSSSWDKFGIVLTTIVGWGSIWSTYSIMRT